MLAASDWCIATIIGVDLALTHIALLTNSGWAMARHRGEQIRSMIEYGWKISAIADYSTYRDETCGLGADTYHVPFGRALTNPFQHISCAAQLAKLLLKLRPDILHCFGVQGIIHGSAAAWIARVPAVVHTLTGQGILAAEGHQLLRPVASQLCKVALLGRAAVIFQNLYDLATFVERGVVDADRAIHIPGCGIDVDAFGEPPSRPQARSFIHASRMVESKGVREFVEAARIVRQKRPEATFHLYGGCQDDYPFHNPDFIDRSWLESLNQEGIVRWHGVVPPGEVEAALRSPCTIALVNLSRYGEGVPRIGLEAACAGLPIITTNRPGCRDVVDNLHSGYLCNGPRFADEAATVMIELLDDPAKAMAWGKRGREFVRRFDIRHVMHNTFLVYERAFPRNPGTPDLGKESIG
jgi:glycosyltransferase involved in cell wall biosynthesis